MTNETITVPERLIMSFQGKFKVKWYYNVIDDKEHRLNEYSGVGANYLQADKIDEDVVKEIERDMIETIDMYKLKNNKVEIKAVIYGIYGNEHLLRAGKIVRMFDKGKIVTETV